MQRYPKYQICLAVGAVGSSIPSAGQGPLAPLPSEAVAGSAARRQLFQPPNSNSTSPAQGCLFSFFLFLRFFFFVERFLNLSFWRRWVTAFFSWAACTSRARQLALLYLAVGVDGGFFMFVLLQKTALPGFIVYLFGGAG